MWLLGVMFANSVPPLVYVSTTLRTPPMIMSPEKTVLLVPSENVRVSIPQSSTSTGLALMKGRSRGGRQAATFPTSAVTPETEIRSRSEEHTSELQSLRHLVCRLLL